MSSNPYEAPTAALRDAEDARPRARARFPVFLVLRWLLGLALVVYGLLQLAHVFSQWDWLADRAIIDKGNHPLLWLVLHACTTAAGVLLLWRSRWVFVPIVLHIVLYLWEVFGFGHQWIVRGDYQVFAVELLALGFAVWLWMKRRLR